MGSTVRKQAYSNILKLLPPKNENFSIKILIFFIFLLQNIDCGYSLEPSLETLCDCWRTDALGIDFSEKLSKDKYVDKISQDFRQYIDLILFWKLSLTGLKQPLSRGHNLCLVWGGKAEWIIPFLLHPLATSNRTLIRVRLITRPPSLETLCDCWRTDVLGIDFSEKAAQR